MDDARFDRLAAALAAASSRRGLLLSGAGGLLAVLGRGRQDAAARKKRRCKGNKKRCHKRCIPKTNCCTARDCPEKGDICEQAVCRQGRCAIAQRRTGSPCDTDQFCVVDESCNADGVCQGTPRSCGDGIDCDADPNHCGECGRRCLIESPSSCGETGQCVGGVCQKYGTGPICRPAACLNDFTLRLAGRCDGNGGCAPSQTQDCTPYGCNSAASRCYESCGGDPKECAPDHFCDQGQCKPERDNGEACQLNSQCASNFCDNGTCQPKRANGEPCSDEGQCASNICVLGTCCSTFCTTGQPCPGGTCQA